MASKRDEEAPKPGGITLPRLPSFARWRRLAASRHTLLRALQYEALQGVRVSGRVLDLGGDRRSEYHEIFDATGAKFHVVNMALSARPDTIVDLEHPLPFSDACFDHLISLNTFEHLFNDRLALGEGLRVLRSGGTFHIVIPFCHCVHGSPRDFHRHTADWWLTTLSGLGAREVTVEPLVWDRRSSGAALINTGRIARRLVMATALIDAKAAVGQLARAVGMTRILGRPVPERAERQQRKALRASTFALGYYVWGRK